MKLLKTVASVFYENLDQGKEFFINILGFHIVHEDEGLCVVTKDDVTFHISIDEEYSKILPPLYRVETDNIQELWKQIKLKDPKGKYLHDRFPNGPELRPWGAYEFAYLDSQVCLVFQQWK
jgi:hypothetical protein